MPIVGTLSYPRGYNVAVEWEIEDFFNRFNDDNLLSPDLWLSDGAWQLGISRNKVKKGQDFGWISLILCRYRHGELKQIVDVTLAIKNIDGSLYNSQRFFHEFDSTSAKEFKKFIELSKLLVLRDSLVPDNTLTVFCSVSLLDSNVEREIIPFGKPEGILTLVQNFSELCINGCHADITIKVKDQEFQAHRSILAARSSVFASRFQHETDEEQSCVVNIDDCDPNYFKSFLLYLYSGKAGEVSSDNVFYLYDTANKYDLKDLKETCLQFMVRFMSVDSFCDTVRFAKSENKPAVLNYATEFFIKKLTLILRTRKWAILMKEDTDLANELLISLACKTENWKTDLMTATNG